jgi:hypothetical protein
MANACKLQFIIFLSSVGFSYLRIGSAASRPAASDCVRDACCDIVRRGDEPHRWPKANRRWRTHEVKATDARLAASAQDRVAVNDGDLRSERVGHKSQSAEIDSEASAGNHVIYVQ